MDNRYDEEYYSVVAAYSQNGNLWYYRLADIDVNKNRIVEANYNTDDDAYIYEPVTLYSRDPNKIEYKPIIVKWRYDEFDERKQYTENSDLKGKIYEVVFLQDDIEFVDYDEGKTRKKLIDGFYINKDVSREFLLIVGRNENYLIALLCNQKMFKTKNVEINNPYDKCLYFDKDEKDLAKSMSTVDLYRIEDDSIVSIDNLLDHPFTKRIDITNRFFYDQLRLPNKKEKFFIRNADDYTIAFFTKYLKEIKNVFTLSNRERLKIIEIIQSIDNAKDLLDEFQKNTGYDSSTLLNTFKEIGFEVINAIREDSEMKQILKEYLLYDDEFYGECLAEIKEEWEKSDDFAAKQKERENQALSLLAEIDRETKELERIKGDIKQNQDESHSINNIILELLEKKKAIEESINNSLKEYKNNIVSIIKDVAPFELVNQNVHEQSEIKGYIHKISRISMNNGDIDSVESGNHIEFYEDLSENLSSYYSMERSNDIAASILSSMACSKAIVVDEAIGEKIAECLSLLCDNGNLDRYLIFGPDVNTSSLLESISNNDSQIIYIDGVLNSYNEQLLKLLVKTFSDKCFIFSVDEENIFLLSKGLWKYATYISLGEGYQGKTKNDRLIASNYKIRLKILNTNIKSNDKCIHNLGVLTDYQIIESTKILNAYFDYYNQDKLPAFYLNQILLNAGVNSEMVKKALCENYPEEMISKSILPKIMSDEL